jgi:hypothetical protein
MARELLIATNPRRRKRKLSTKQRAAALRNLRKARAARKRGGPSKRRRNPARPASRSVVRYRTRRAPRVRRNPARRRLFPAGLVDRQLMPALIGGGGAVVNDVTYNFLLNMIPAGTGGIMLEQFRTGYARHVGKAASALLLAWGAGFVLARRTADQLGAGALTVVGYNVVRDVMAQVAPTLPLGWYDGMGAYIPSLGYAGAGASPGGRLNLRHGSDYTRSGLARLRGMGAYVPNGRGRVGIPPQLRQTSHYRAPADSSTAAEGYSENYGG